MAVGSELEVFEPYGDSRLPVDKKTRAAQLGSWPRKSVACLGCRMNFHGDAEALPQFD